MCIIHNFELVDESFGPPASFLLRFTVWKFEVLVSEDTYTLL